MIQTISLNANLNFFQKQPAKLILGILLFGLLTSGCGVEKPAEIAEAEQNIPDKIDFNYHVKPILSDKCFACHGPDLKNRKGDLRLDTEDGAYAALKDAKNMHAIVPGRLGKSAVYARLISEDPDYKMPPPDSNLELTAEEIAIIFKWIEQGATYEPHWSFISPKKPKIPKVKEKDWPQNPIDQFILARLEKEKLAPAQKANPEELIRRVSFDLTGLPPTLEEVEAFQADPSSQAYEKLVDRLLASPSYGERMASDWMDVARFADSDGYLDDKHRDFSPWRDWVISAFNRNMPYDQFITWQLAGDLLPNRTKESILATAFNRLHKKNSEAGIIFEEYRVEYVADRVHTLGQGILGLSLQCARCHDHKYDPISQEDYFRLFAFFNSTFETGSPVYGPDQTPGPALLLTKDDQEDLIRFLNQEIEGYEKQLSNLKNRSEEAFKSWISNTGVSPKSLHQKVKESLVAYYPFDEVREVRSKKITPNLVNRNLPATCNDPLLKPGVKGNAFFVSDYNSVVLGNKIGWYERTEPFSVSLWIYPAQNYPDAGVFYHCEDLRLGLKGYSLKLENNKLQFIIAHSYPQNSIQISTVQPIKEKEWVHVTITYDGSSKAHGTQIYLNGKLAEVTVDYDNLYKGILYEWNIHTYGFKGFMLGQRSLMLPFKDGGLDELKIYNRQLTPLEVLYEFNPDEALSILKDEKDRDHYRLLREYYFAHYLPDPSGLTDSLLNKRNELNGLMNSIPEIMVMGDMPKPRPTYVLDRGLYNAPGEIVKPGTPSQLFEYNSSLPPNRLGLAKWLFDPRHPLTARVFVNRIWQQHFGTGLVRTPGDFGNQGALPSHPELLDWLAVEFIESGWDIKKLHKVIVTSATYQQSSIVTPDKQERDPENILLARGARFRLSAEMIRDNALATSGLLVRKMGGPSVYPYQPEGLWDEISDKVWRYKYLQEPGEGLYRRSLYTVWKRTAPPPSMLIFDLPERGECAVNRRKTNTPLQALVLLNDPQYVEAARVLAENLLKQSSTEDKRHLLTTAFRVITGRKPDSKECEILENYYDEEVTRFRESPKKAADYLSTGYLPVDENIPHEELAALATVVHSIMNTDEAITRK